MTERSVIVRSGRLCRPDNACASRPPGEPLGVALEAVGSDAEVAGPSEEDRIDASSGDPSKMGIEVTSGHSQGGGLHAHLIARNAKALCLRNRQGGAVGVLKQLSTNHGDGHRVAADPEGGDEASP